jgi:diaminopimelate decarboxylase
MADNPRPALYQAQYTCALAGKMNEPDSTVVSIAGRTCESGDMLIWNATLPEAEAGDIMAVFSTGAYNYSMASNYNMLPHPAVVLVKDGKAELMVARQTTDDLIKNDKVPSWL